MPYIRIMCQHHLANNPTTCKVSLTSLSGRSKAKVGLRCVLGADVLATIGAKSGDRLELLWGSGPEAGSVCIVRSDVGVVAKRDPSTTPDVAITTFVNMPKESLRGEDGSEWKLATQPRPAQPVRWTNGENGIVICLPSEWWTNSHSDARKELQRLTTVPMPPKRDVA